MKELNKKILSFIICILISFLYLYLLCSMSIKYLRENNIDKKFNAEEIVDIKDEKEKIIFNSSHVRFIINEVVNGAKNYIFFDDEILTSSEVLEKVDNSLDLIIEEISLNEEKNIIRTRVFNQVNGINEALISIKKSQNNNQFGIMEKVFSQDIRKIVLIIVSVLIFILLLLNSSTWIVNNAKGMMVISSAYLISTYILCLISYFGIKATVNFNVETEFFKSIVYTLKDYNVKISIILFLIGFISSLVYFLFFRKKISVNNSQTVS